MRPKTQQGPDELGLGPTPAAAELTRIAVLDRVRGAAAPVASRAEVLDVVTALEVLVPQTSSLSWLPRGLVTLCETLDRLGGAHRLVYAEADDLREAVDGLLATPPEPVDPIWEPLTEAELAASLGDAGPGAVARRAVDDGVLVSDGRIVLLADTRLVVLEGPGPAVWLLLDEALTPDQILARMAALGPVPPDAGRLVREAVDAMVASGLLCVSDRPS